MTSKIIQQIESVDKKIATELFAEYKKIKSEYLTGDWSNCLVHSGRFSELIVAFIKTMYDGKPVNINSIKFDTIYRDLTSRPKPNPEDEILLLAVPHAAKTVYTIRSKKKVAHIKAIDPDFIDGVNASNICDWMLAQIVLLKCNSKPKEVSNFIHSLIDRRIPLIEEFEDGSILVLKKTSFRDELLLALYKINMRIKKEDIKTIIKVAYPQKLNSTLRLLENNKLIHVNDNGVKITRLGIEEAEKIILNHKIT